MFKDKVISNSTQNINNSPENKETSLFQKLLKRPFRLFLAVIFLLIILFWGFVFWLNSPSGQAFAKDEITTALSDKTGLDVTIGKVDVDIFRHLILDEVNIVEGVDTLLGVENLSVKADFTALFSNKLAFTALSLSGVSTNTYVDTSGVFNLQPLLDVFKQQPSTNTNPSKFSFDIKDISLSDISIRHQDEEKGDKIGIELVKANVSIAAIDKAFTQFDIRKIFVDGLVVDVWKSGAKIKAEQKDSLVNAAIDEGVKSSSFFKVQEVVVRNTAVGFEEVGAVSLSKFNAKHFYFKDIALSANDVYWSDTLVNTTLEGFSCRDSMSGFAVDKITAIANYDGNKIAIESFQLKTPFTDLKATVEFTPKYKNNQLNIDKSRFKWGFQSAELSPKDVAFFVPNLTTKPVYKLLAQKKVFVDGQIYGSLSSLKSKGLSVEIGDMLTFNGDVKLRNLRTPKDMFVSLRLDDLTTTASFIDQVSQSDRLPIGFYHLGNLRFKGKFDGFLEDFVADGNLRTDIGSFNTFVRLNLKDNSSGSYSGGLQVKSFDLGKWFESEELGVVSLNAEVKGKGFELNTLNTLMKGSIDSIGFRGYNYKGIIVDGKIKDKFFDGILNIKDPNLKTELSGIIDLNQASPIYDLKLNTDHLDLFALNLSKKPLKLEGSATIDFTGDKLNTVIGSLDMRDVRVVLKNKTIPIEYFKLNASGDTLSRKLLVQSSLVNGSASGRFNANTIFKDAKAVIARNLPQYYGLLTSDSLASKRIVTNPNQQLDFYLNVNDKDSLLYVFLPEFKRMTNTFVKGKLDLAKEQFEFKSATKYLGIKTEVLEDAQVSININKDEIDVLGNSGLIQSKRQVLKNLWLHVSGDNDKTAFKVFSDDFHSKVPKVKLEGEVLDFNRKKISISLFDSYFDLQDQRWNISSPTPIVYSAKYLKSDLIKIFNEDQTITAQFGGQSGQINVENLDISFVNPLVNNPKFDFGGALAAQLSMDNIFSQRDISLDLKIDDITINGDDWGKIRFDAVTPSLNNTIHGNLLVTDGSHFTRGVVYYNPKTVKDSTLVPNYLEVNAQIKDFPANFFNYLITSGVTEIEGFVNGKARVYGPLTDPVIDVKVVGEDVATTVEYLQTHYKISQDTVYLTNQMVDFTGLEVYDELGNKAIVRGGFPHDNFFGFTLDIAASSDRFMLINTKPEDNSTYYGKGIGAVDIQFSNDFAAPHIDLETNAQKGTVFNLPMDEVGDASTGDYVRFISEKDLLEDSKEAIRLRGVTMDMDISANEDALVRIVFDEQAGDIIQANGEGNLKMALDLAGNFDMIGRYEIQKGDYLFTYRNLINKPFGVKPGGSIVWTGDPYGAKLDIEAIYAHKSPPASFIAEFLNPEDKEQYNEATKPTEVNLQMFITGSLLKPTINFDFEFPQIDGPLKSFVETKLRSLRGDQNALNRQVFALLVLGSFLPSDIANDSFGSSNQIITNTLTEFISSQISMYLTNVLSEAFTDLKFVDDVQLDLDYRVYDQQSTSIDNISSTGSEIEVGLSNTLLNNKLLISIGGNFEVANNSAVSNQDNVGSYVAGDFLIEYKLTADGRFRIRGYQTTEQAIEGRKNKTGVGLSYRKEFDSFTDFVKSIKKNIKDKKEE